MTAKPEACEGPATTGAAGTGRRMLPRVAAQLLVQIRFQGMPAPLMGQVRDIGPGGLCLETASRFARDSLRSVSVDFADRTAPFKVDGCWQRDAPGRTGVLTGVRFVDLQPSESEHLWSYVYARAGELASFLRGRSDLSGMDYDEAVDLTLFTRLVHFAAGDCIYKRGSLGTRGDSAFVVYRGKVILEARSGTGRSAYTDHVAEGGVFGGMPLLAAAPHPETATAETDLLALEIDSHSYRYLESSRPQAVRWVSQALFRRYAGRLERLIEQPGVRPAPGP